MLAALTRAVETRHPSTKGHAGRVAELALAVARSLAWDESELAKLRLGALIHDVGKLSLETRLLGKPGPLTTLEQALMRTHPAAGARLISHLDEARPGLTCVLYHHERWDGDGYPLHIAGGEIPVEARLIAIADAYDAMTSMRPYRGPLTHDSALAEIARCAGTQFDPVLANASIEVWSSAARVAV
jgi:HD-GYP domain-containing protein (c-di-GMP phosphodiesterase class II)